MVVGWLAATPVDAGAAGTPPPTGVMRCRRTFIVLAFALGILLSLPPSVQESLPERHLARHVVEVVGGLDLSALERDHGGWGSAAYHPATLLALLITATPPGVFPAARSSGRRMTRRVLAPKSPRRSTTSNKLGRCWSRCKRCPPA